MPWFAAVRSALGGASAIATRSRVTRRCPSAITSIAAIRPVASAALRGRDGIGGMRRASSSADRKPIDSARNDAAAAWASRLRRASANRIPDTAASSTPASSGGSVLRAK